MNKDQVAKLIARYNSEPYLFGDSFVDQLQTQAVQYGLPFRKKTLSTTDDTPLEEAGRIISQIPIGYMEGMTTLKTSAIEPNDPYEKIARNIGHLAGFIGILPGVGTTASGAPRLAKLGLKTSRLGTTGFSLPMVAASGAEKLMGKLITSSAVNKLVTKKIAKSVVDSTAGMFAANLAKEAFHLGVASSVSTWTEGVDRMMESFISGSVAGFAFGGLHTIIPDIGTGYLRAFPRAMATSLMQGLPSTLRKDTTPEQIYEYTLGAWFGKDGRAHRETISQYVSRRFRTTIEGTMLDFVKSQAQDINGFNAALLDKFLSMGLIYRSNKKYYQIMHIDINEKSEKIGVAGLRRVATEYNTNKNGKKVVDISYMDEPLITKKETVAKIVEKFDYLLTDTFSKHRETIPITDTGNFAQKKEYAEGDYVQFNENGVTIVGQIVGNPTFKPIPHEDKGMWRYLIKIPGEKNRYKKINEIDLSISNPIQSSIKEGVTLKQVKKISLKEEVSDSQDAVTEQTKGKVTFRERITRKEVRENSDTIYLFGDNLLEEGLGGQAQEMRGEKNAIGIPTKRYPGNRYKDKFKKKFNYTPEDEYFSDSQLAVNKKNIDKAFSKIPKNKNIVIPKAGFGTERAKLKEKAPKTFEYLQEKLSELTKTNISGEMTQSTAESSVVVSKKSNKQIAKKITFNSIAKKIADEIKLTKAEEDYGKKNRDAVKRELKLIKKATKTKSKSSVMSSNESVKLSGGYEESPIKGSGKGTIIGDGKDIAMRKVADSAIVELASEHPSSSKTTIDYLGKANSASKIVMLARNGKLKGKELRQETIDAIDIANNNGAKFVVGDMPGVDTQFIDHLKMIGADFTIYHTGNMPRIKTTNTKPQSTIKQATQSATTASSFDEMVNTIAKKRKSNVPLSMDELELLASFPDIMDGVETITSEKTIELPFDVDKNTPDIENPTMDRPESLNKTIQGAVDNHIEYLEDAKTVFMNAVEKSNTISEFREKTKKYGSVFDSIPDNSVMAYINKRKYGIDVRKHKVMFMDDGSIVPMTEVDNTAPHWKYKTTFDERMEKGGYKLDSTFRRIDKFEHEGKVGSITVFKKIETALEKMIKRGKFVYYNRSDDPTWYQFDLHPDLVPLLSNPQEGVKNYLLSEGFTSEDIMNLTKQLAWSEKKFKQNTKLSEKQISNWLWLNAANLHAIKKLDYGDYYLSTNKQDLDVVGLIKRQALFDAPSGIPLPKYTNSRGEDAKEVGLNAIYFDKLGKESTDYDGPLVARPELFDAMADLLGVDPIEQFKGSIAFTTGEGACAQKFAIFKASTPEEIKILDKFKVDVFGSKDIVKILGTRKPGDVYSIPLDGFRVMGALDNKYEKHNKRPIYRQILYSTQNSELFMAINTKSLELRNKLKGLTVHWERGDHQSFYTLQDEFFRDVFGDVKPEQFIDELTPSTGIAGDLINSYGADLSILNLPGVSHYAHERIRAYIVDKIINPEFLAVSTFFRGKPLGISKIFPKLAIGVENEKNIVFGDKTNIKLDKKTWNIIIDNIEKLNLSKGKTNQIAAIKAGKLEKLSDWFDIQSEFDEIIPLPVVGARGPIEDKGGIAVFHLYGLHEGGGAQLYMSRTGMEKMAGADSDADKATFWFDLPTSYVSEVNKNWNHLLKETKAVDIKVKNTVEKIGIKNNPTIADPMAWMNPHLVAKVGYAAVKSKEAVGIVSNLKRDLSILAQKPSKRKLFITKDADGKPIDIQRNIDLHTKELYRMTLDATKYGGLDDINKYINLKLKSILKDPKSFLNSYFRRDFDSLCDAIFKGKRSQSKYKLDYSKIQEISERYKQQYDSELTSLEKLLVSLPSYETSLFTTNNYRTLESWKAYHTLAQGSPYGEFLTNAGIKKNDNIFYLNNTTVDKLLTRKLISIKRLTKGVWSLQGKQSKITGKQLPSKLSLIEYLRHSATVTDLEGLLNEEGMKRDELLKEFDKRYKENKEGFRKKILNHALRIANKHFVKDVYDIVSNKALLHQDFYSINKDDRNDIDSIVDYYKEELQNPKNRPFLDTYIRDIFKESVVKKTTLSQRYALARLLSSKIKTKEFFKTEQDVDEMMPLLLTSKVLPHKLLKDWVNNYRLQFNLTRNGEVFAPLRGSPKISESKVKQPKVTTQQFTTLFSNTRGLVFPEVPLGIHTDSDDKDMQKLLINLEKHPLYKEYFIDILRNKWGHKFADGGAGIWSLTPREISGLNTMFGRLDFGTRFQQLISRFTGMKHIELNRINKEFFPQILGEFQKGMMETPRVNVMKKANGFSHHEWVTLTSPMEYVHREMADAQEKIEIEMARKISGLKDTIAGDVSIVQAFSYLNRYLPKREDQYAIFDIAVRKYEARAQEYKKFYKDAEYSSLSAKRRKLIDETIKVLEVLKKHGETYQKNELSKVEIFKRQFIASRKELSLQQEIRMMSNGEVTEDYINKYRKKYGYKIKDNKIIVSPSKFKFRKIFFPHKHIDTQDFNENLELHLADPNVINKYRGEALKFLEKVRDIGEKPIHDKKSGIAMYQGKKINNDLAGFIVEAIASDEIPTELIEDFTKYKIKKIRDHAQRGYWKEKSGEIPFDEDNIRFTEENLNLTFSHTKQRILSVPGWRRTMDVYEEYFRDLYRVKNLTRAAVLSYREVLNMETKGKKHGYDDKLIHGWKNQIIEYIKDNLGHPVEERKAFGLKFLQVSDKAFARKLNKIKFALLGKQAPPLNGNYESVFRASQVEGMYQLGTLLMHPKSSTQNAVYGTATSAMLGGHKNLFKALRVLRHAKYSGAELANKRLPELIPEYPELHTQEGINKLINDSGVILEFFQNELGQKAESGNFKLFFKHARNAMYENRVKEIPRIAKKYGIGSLYAKYVGAFMSKPEKMLRFSSFLTGYLHARDYYGEDHRGGIFFGRKFTEASQFMYNVAWRPRATRTNLGKILTRFRMWAWSSMALRRRLYHHAQDAGFELSNPDVIRFNRSAVIDIFGIALANALGYTLFDYGLPEPYNTLQDAAGLIFGDKKKRQRAFYGTYGLGAVMPPIGRIPFGIVKAMATMDLHELTQYQMWTWFPGGRLARDVYKVINNPEKLVDNITGIPIQRTSWYLKAQRKKYELPTL